MDNIGYNSSFSLLSYNKYKYLILDIIYYSNTLSSVGTFFREHCERQFSQFSIYIDPF